MMKLSSIKMVHKGYRHSSVDSSALSILLPRVQLPSTPSTLLSFIVKFVRYLSLQSEKRTKINKKDAWFGPFFFKKMFHILFVRTLKAQDSFSSGVPENVMSVAIMNSLKSIDPFPSRSKIRKILNLEHHLSKFIK